MFDRFRQQYPQGSITSNLVQIHGDRYIVSVSVTNDRLVLVSSLAADPKIEVAEARALAQALHILGLSQPETMVAPMSGPELPIQPEPSPVATSESIVTAQTAETEETITAVLPVQSAVLPELPLPITQTASVPVQEHPPTQPYQPDANEQSLSVTDMIPLINMELKRLNWSREKGRDCIIALYNKRSSSLLSDEELLGLLRYLQAQTVPD